MKINWREYEVYKQVEKDNLMYSYYADDDLNETVVVTDENDNIISEAQTGNCACCSCREGA